MKILIDQDVWASTISLLQRLGHDVVPVGQLGLARAVDAQVLQLAHQQDRILITRDRDFGALVFLQQNAPGVVYLRILPSTLSVVHAELEQVLSQYTESELRTSFVVVEPGRHRIRRQVPKS